MNLNLVMCLSCGIVRGCFDKLQLPYMTNKRCRICGAETMCYVGNVTLARVDHGSNGDASSDAVIRAADVPGDVAP